MNKVIIMFCLVVFELVGSYLPVLIFKLDIFSMWVILGGAIGGFFGIWVGVKISQRLE